MPTTSSPGDSEGRRLSRRRATHLSEAAALARVLQVLLERAGFDTSSTVELTKEIVRQEQAELQRSYGRVEPRTRFSGMSPHPLLDHWPINNLLLDESGLSAIQLAVKGPSFFALSGIAMDDEEIPVYIASSDEIKMRFFGEKDFMFHEPEMRNREGRYYFGGDQERQKAFDQALATLIADSKFTAFGVGLRKHLFLKDYIDTGNDPYLPVECYALAIMLLLERYVDFLAFSGSRRMGRLTFESQGAKEDAYHQLEYARLLLEGSQWVTDSVFRNWLETGLRFMPKGGSDPMELADMFSRDLFEWVRSECTVVPLRWTAFEEKIYYRGDGMMGKFGVKIFPDSDIRETVEAHRVRVLEAKTKSAPSQGEEAPIAETAIH